MLSVSLLGDFCIRYGEKPVTGLDTPRLQSLLAYLLLHREAPQSRARLAFLFWPDTSEAQARTNLRNLLHHLRHALPQADSYVDTGLHTLGWRRDAPFALDVIEFKAALADAEQATGSGEPADTRAALERAARLYNGDLLPSCYDDWIIPEREALRQEYLSALERLVRMLEDQRDYPAAIHHAQRLLRHDPLHEATYRCLIRLHALNGDRAGALRVYHTCTTVLRRELDVEPAAATREAYEQVLGAESPPSPPVPPSAVFSPLVGRDREWAQMLQAWRAVAAGGEPHTVLLRGEAGIGKTRLVEDLLQWAARQGIASASARCYAAEGDLAYAPVTAWLRLHPLPPLEDVWLAEMARLLPEVLAQRPDLPRPVALTEAWQRQHLFEALSRAIVGRSQPLLLTIDDLQWCDQDTLEWLHFLLRYDPQAHLLVVGAYRPEEIGESHPLRASLQALRLAGQVTEVDLPPLDEAATHTLAALVAGVEISTAIARLIYRETEGNPLFVVETVRAGLPAHGQKLFAGPPLAGLPLAGPPLAGPPFTRPLFTGHSVDSLPDDAGLPPRVKSVIEARLAQLSPPTRELAGLAAVIGREFSFRLLARASGCDEDTLVRQLDELWQRRIVREHGVDAYDFTHDKLREVAYRGMSAARRRLLHRHVAQALEALHAAELSPVSRQVAAHYESAGLPEQAIPYYLRAAGVARQVYANDEAIALLQRGLALAEGAASQASVSGIGYEVAVDLWESLADIFELKAQHEDALQAYQRAQSLVPSKDRIRQARLHHKVGAVFREQRLYAQALEACRQAEITLEEQPEEDNSSWWDEWMEVQIDRVWAHYWLAQWPEMDALVNKVQPVVQERGNAARRVRFLMASCLLHLRKYRYVVSDEMLAKTRQALAASLQIGTPAARIECQFEVGFLLLWRGELDEAEGHLQAALALAETCGIAQQRTLCRTYLTILNRFRGKIDEVMDYAQRAQEAAETAHMPDYVAAAKGNQAWLAWRKGDLIAAERMGNEALSLWQQSPLVYPFQWQALWPLIGVALRGDREPEAWDYVQALLEAKQQRLPDELNTSLVAAVRALAEGQAEAARLHLDRAMELARETGYL